ncbi:phage tail fiber protein [Xenorhabdus aichiensis]|uniref:phage tail fiber protein n=1 Tax=Xenorhabdus aichiensis TaxID=3025874 RepID=UPI00278C2A97|nr:hypothetical protein [Xenorhabdus aichiensis]
MTYHREHPNVPAFARNTREGYSDGDLIDIPSGRFVSVRVQMSATKDDTKITPVWCGIWSRKGWKSEVDMNPQKVAG